MYYSTKIPKMLQHALNGQIRGANGKAPKQKRLPLKDQGGTFASAACGRASE